MKVRHKILVSLFFVMTVIASKNSFGESETTNFETRCGWLSNPIPRTFGYTTEMPNG